MGNSRVSCECTRIDVCLSATRIDASHRNTCKVVHSITAETLEFSQPIKAAELMLEFPNHFLCHSSSFQLGQRVLPLPSHQELELAQLYFLLPMQKLHARLSVKDVAVLANTLAGPRKGGKVLSSDVEDAMQGRMLSIDTPMTENCRRASWRPTLQPITESPLVQKAHRRVERNLSLPRLLKV